MKNENENEITPQPDKKPLEHPGNPQEAMEGPVSSLVHKVGEYMAEEKEENTEAAPDTAASEKKEEIPSSQEGPELKNGQKIIEFQKKHDGKTTDQSEKDSAEDAEKWHHEG